MTTIPSTQVVQHPNIIARYVHLHPNLTLDRLLMVMLRDGQADRRYTFAPLCILSYLAFKLGTTVTRVELMEQVFGIDYLRSGSVAFRRIDVHIRRLRMLLPDPDLIETVQGRGYRIPRCALRSTLRRTL